MTKKFHEVLLWPYKWNQFVLREKMVHSQVQTSLKVGKERSYTLCAIAHGLFLIQNHEKNDRNFSRRSLMNLEMEPVCSAGKSGVFSSSNETQSRQGSYQFLCTIAHEFFWSVNPKTKMAKFFHKRSLSP